MFEITCVNKIVSYELRTLKRSLTFHYTLVDLNQMSNECLSKVILKINDTKNIYTNFLNELFNLNETSNYKDEDINKKKFERVLGLNEKMNGFEIVIIDKLGNLFKHKFNFSIMK